MALTPDDEKHALQIQAGVLGRRAGHEFEDTIAERVNSLHFPFVPVELTKSQHVFRGEPATLLLSYLARHHGIRRVSSAVALSTGALATSEAGKQWLSVNGVKVSRCKSDLIITLSAEDGLEKTTGISTKQCGNKQPTNAQLYFTTARGFSSLLKSNGLKVSDAAEKVLRQFCGDSGFRPSDQPALSTTRKIDPRRFFWEELSDVARDEWQALLTTHQDDVSRLLLQKAYINDPFVPEYLLHKTKFADSWESTEVALYGIEELIALSREYQGFTLRPYRVSKGSHRDPPGVTHMAPRFGVIQMQRGGQKQHPEQLQFNLEASYFYKI